MEARTAGSQRRRDGRLTTSAWSRIDQATREGAEAEHDGHGPLRRFLWCPRRDAASATSVAGGVTVTPASLPAGSSLPVGVGFSDSAGSSLPWVSGSRLCRRGVPWALASGRRRLWRWGVSHPGKRRRSPAGRSSCPLRSRRPRSRCTSRSARAKTPVSGARLSPEDVSNSPLLDDRSGLVSFVDVEWAADCRPQPGNAGGTCTLSADRPARQFPCPRRGRRRPHHSWDPRVRLTPRGREGPAQGLRPLLLLPSV